MARLTRIAGVLRLPDGWSGSVLGHVQGFEPRTVGMLTA